MVATRIPIRSAACIITRPANEDLFEVLLLKRHENTPFMGGYYVFPGGKHDPVHDEDKSWLLSGSQSLHQFDDWSLRVAAARETLEETGILLSVPKARCVLDATLVNRFRKHVDKNPSDFRKILEQHDLKIGWSSLIPWHRFIGPSYLKKRFDTIFYLTLPYGKEYHNFMNHASADGHEAVDLKWLTPNEALAQAQEKRIKLPPPQWYMLHELNMISTISKLEVEAKKRPPEPTIYRPLLHIDKDLLRANRVATLLPGDESHYPFAGSKGDRHRMIFDRADPEGASPVIEFNLKKV